MRMLRSVTLGLALALAACGQGSGIAVEQARVMLPVIPDRPGSAYFIIEGSGSRLTAVTSPRVQRIELHETRNEGGRSTMAPIANVPFDDTGRIDFAPGGKHAMLFGIDPSARAGTTIPLTFTFDGAAPVTVEADVQAAVGGAHTGH